jgi:hypothetical protein
MAVLEEVKNMQQQGIPEDQIVKALQERGISYKEISDALTQTKIKAAIEEPAQEPIQENTQASDLLQQTSQSQQVNPSQSHQGMQESMMASPQTLQPQDYQQPQESSQQQNYDDNNDYYQGYQSYDQSGISSDTIAEISEQIVSEKIEEVRKRFEKLIDFKTTIETKTESLEERLKRIEKIIDSLQESVLKKVGAYTSNISDIKKELIQTQNTFSKLLPKIKSSTKKETRKHYKKSKK